VPDAVSGTPRTPRSLSEQLERVLEVVLRLRDEGEGFKRAGQQVVPVEVGCDPGCSLVARPRTGQIAQLSSLRSCSPAAGWRDTGSVCGADVVGGRWSGAHGVGILRRAAGSPNTW
jgi:hypothetical protein